LSGEYVGGEGIGKTGGRLWGSCKSASSAEKVGTAESRLRTAEGKAKQPRPCVTDRGWARGSGMNLEERNKLQTPDGLETVKKVCEKKKRFISSKEGDVVLIKRWGRVVLLAGYWGELRMKLYTIRRKKGKD